MDELIIDGKVYVSSKKAAKISGYAKDYVGQMCREGRIESRLVGRSWYVLLDALNQHRFKGTDAEKLEEKVAVEATYPAWERPKYSVVENKPLPTLGSRPSVNQLPEAPSARDLHVEDKEHEALVTQMQSAWQEWFTQKGTGEAAAQRPALATEEEEEVAIAVRREEEEVPEEEIEDSELEQEEIEVSDEEDVVVEQEEEEVPLIRITESKVVRREETPAKRRAPVPSPWSRVFLQGTFALISLAAVFTALVGTDVIHAGSLKLPGIQFLAGANAIRGN